MKYNPEIHRRKTIRLSWYDYSQEWLYFITISVQNKLCLFWKIVSGEMYLNNAGNMIEKEWIDIENRFQNTKLHNFVVMPNHFHAIIENVSNDESIKLWDVIWGFKSITTHAYIELVHAGKAKNFNKKLWQRNYYEHIIRDEVWYNKISDYIENNIERWNEDIFYIDEF